MSISIDGSKSLVEDLPSKYQPIARFPIFLFLILLTFVAAPIVFALRFFGKPTINTFFKLRTELETKGMVVNKKKLYQS